MSQHFHFFSAFSRKKSPDAKKVRPNGETLHDLVTLTFVESDDTLIQIHTFLFFTLSSKVSSSRDRAIKIYELQVEYFYACRTTNVVENCGVIPS
jgi:hypothetical protein